MKTPTHMMINVLVSKTLGMDKFQERAFVIGGAAPDVPMLIAFGACCLLAPDIASGVDDFRQLYDHNPLMIAVHNLLHSPMSLALLFLLTTFITRPFWHTMSRYFLAGSMSHSFVDLFTHANNDGPLILFPFEWSLRFNGGLSHWDFSQGAGWVASAELLICVYFIGFVICQLLLSRWMRAWNYFVRSGYSTF